MLISVRRALARGETRRVTPKRRILAMKRQQRIHEIEQSVFCFQITIIECAGESKMPLCLTEEHMDIGLPGWSVFDSVDDSYTECFMRDF